MLKFPPIPAAILFQSIWSAQLTDTEKNPGWEAIGGNIKEIAGACGPGLLYLVGAVPGCVHWVVRVATDSGPADPAVGTERKHL